MPCYSPPGAYGLECHDEKGDCTKRIKARLDSLTRMLCEANRIIDPIPHQKRRSRSTELARWWVEHQTFDKKRKRHDTV